MANFLVHLSRNMNTIISIIRTVLCVENEIFFCNPFKGPFSYYLKHLGNKKYTVVLQIPLGVFR